MKLKKKYRDYQPDQLMIITFDSSIKFPKGSFERFLVDILGEIDISSFYLDKEKDKGGGVPYNPRALLGTIFYGIVNGVFSLRKLEYHSEHNDAFMFVSGFCKPDHSTIGNFLNDHRESIKDVFTQIVYIANEAGYVDMNTCSFDGTKMKANASKEFTGTLADFEKKKGRLQKKIKELMEKLKDTDGSEAIKEKAELEQKLEKLQKKEKKISDFLSQAKKDTSMKGGKERKQNITDNASRLMKDSRNGGFIQGYNAQGTTENKNQIVVVAEVVSDENDKGQFKPMYEELQKEKEKNNIESNPEEEKNLMDNGFFTLEALKFAEDNGINIYSPPCSDKDFYKDEEEAEIKEQAIEEVAVKEQAVKEAEVKEVAVKGAVVEAEAVVREQVVKEAAEAEVKEQAVKKKQDKLTFRDCELSQDEQGYKLTCPGGLESSSYSVSSDNSRVTLSIMEADKCGRCSRYEACRGKLKDKKRKSFALSLLHFTMAEEIKAYEAKMATEEAKRIYSDRFNVEHPFAHIKNVFNFKKFNHRGLEKVNVIWKLLCSAHNLRTMYSLGLEFDSG